MSPDWTDIGLRLALTLVAGICIGVNRERGGHAAGLRTTVIVGLAACISMIQANILLATSELAGGSMDVLRLPLGILTGVGFIGGGAILRRGDVTTGVTTAATLWLMTVIGLCFGGGQIAVGSIAALVAFVTLSPLKIIGTWLNVEQRASIGVKCESGSDIPDISKSLLAGCEAQFIALRKLDQSEHECVFELRWKTNHHKFTAVHLVEGVRTKHHVTSFEHRTTLT